MTITPGKLYRSRGGRQVRVYATDGTMTHGSPVHGAILMEDGWNMMTWKADGRFWSVQEDPDDILEKWEEEK